jgi:hypothetical protein
LASDRRVGFVDLVVDAFAAGEHVRVGVGPGEIEREHATREHREDVVDGLLGWLVSAWGSRACAEQVGSGELRR